jgi:hypothetical protein
MARQGAHASDQRVLDFVPSAADDDAALRVAAKLVLAGTVLRWGGASSAFRNVREVVTFLPFLLVGLVPTYSPFFMAALEEYGLHLMYLTPNAILILALFAHACEAFVGVNPSVVLFRQLFSLLRSPSLSPSPGAAL